MDKNQNICSNCWSHADLSPIQENFLKDRVMGGLCPQNSPVVAEENKNAQCVICLERKGDQSLKGERS